MANATAGPAGTASKSEQNASKDTSATAKPEKPDQQAYEANLSKAEKELGVAQERMVSIYMGLLKLWRLLSFNVS